MLVLVLGFARQSATAQHEAVSGARTVDWDALKPQIQTALGKDWQECYPDHRRISIVDTSDLTGDGIPAALVDYCQMGAYTDTLTLILLENGKPVAARFRDEHGNAVDPEFLEGASVINGEATILLPLEHAIARISYQMNANDSDCWVEKCEGKAYVLNASSKTFDFEPEVSSPLIQSECRKIRRENACPHRSGTPQKH